MSRPNRLRRAREIAGLTVRQAARMVPMLADLLVEMEARPSWDDVPGYTSEMRSLAAMYGTSVAWLKGADPVIPDEFRRVIRDQGDRLSFQDIDVITETVGMWATKDPA